MYFPASLREIPSCFFPGDIYIFWYCSSFEGNVGRLAKNKVAFSPDRKKRGGVMVRRYLSLMLGHRRPSRGKCVFPWKTGGIFLPWPAVRFAVPVSVFDDG
jgi:hypothetical protein